MSARTVGARTLSVALLALTALAGFLAGAAWRGGQTPAQPPTEPIVRERESSRGDRRLVIDEVGLEPGQRAEVDEIVGHFRTRMRALDAEFRESYRPRQRALFQSSMDSIRSVLDSAQWATYDSLRAVRYGRRGEARDSAPGGAGRGGSSRKESR